jgi:hypothetical protein
MTTSTASEDEQRLQAVNLLSRLYKLYIHDAAWFANSAKLREYHGPDGIQLLGEVNTFLNDLDLLHEIHNFNNPNQTTTKEVNPR